MKALKIFGFIIIIVVAVFLIVPAFLPADVSVSVVKQINAKPELVFRQVNSLKNWLAWSPFEKDTTLVNTFAGPDRGVGAKRQWKSEKTGEGTMTIVKSKPYEFIENQLTFGPDEQGVGSWSFEPVDNGVNVSWTIHVTGLKYPFGKWSGLFMNSLLKPMLENGLTNLKKVAESMPVPDVVKIINTDKTPSLIISDSATMEGMQAMFEKDFGELMAFVKRKQIPVTGENFAIYHNWNPQGYTRISVGVPVGKKVKDYGRIMYFVLPAGKAVFAMHTGGYDTAPTHYAIDEYIKDFNLKTKDFIWETYAYNPMVDKDSTQWKTMIYYPLK